MRLITKLLLARSLAVAVLTFGSVPAVSAQTAYYWNNTTTDWGTASGWTSQAGANAVPTLAAIAQFTSFATVGTGVTAPTINQPSLNAPQAVLSATFASTAAGAGYSVGGVATLTLGGAGSSGVTASGPATTTFNGPQLTGASATDTLSLRATNGSTLVLAGSSTASTNLSVLTAAGSVAGVNVNGGRFVLDNSTTDIANRLSTSGTIKQNGGGTFELIGNAAGGTYNVGLYNTTDNSAGGVNTIRVTSNSTTANTVLNFANTGSFSLRQGTRNVTVFSSNGELGSVNGPRITFDGAIGTPILSNGIIANAATTPGFGIVRDSTGVNFATYSTARGVQSVSSPTQTTATVTTATTAAQLQAFSAVGATGTIGQFDIAGGTTVTATANIGANSLRISPAGPGATLAMGTFNLSPPGLMLDGPNDFTITGTGTLFAGTHYVYVNNANTTLNLSLTLTTGGNAFAFAGPGFLNLTGLVNQNLATTQRVGVYGGVLRANNTQLGFSGASQGILNLMGGILEITGGTNGTGASADFTRPLGQTASATSGVVNFNSATAEQGSGGFSAFGAAASVNIGGAASPASLQWSSTNFVGNGYALKFGSSQSNNTLNFLNPLALDAGTPGTYQLREINVIRGSGAGLALSANRAVLAGVISGSATSDLLKTGNGVLELNQPNTYAGNTFVNGGILLANGAGTPGVSGPTGTGSVLVQSGGTLSGGGTITRAGTYNGVTGGAVNSVTVFSGGTIAPGTSFSDASTTGTLTIEAPVVLKNGAAYAWKLNNATPVVSAANLGLSNLAGAQDQIAITGAGNVFTGGNITFVIRELTVPTFLPAPATYSWLVATGVTPGLPSVGTVTFDLTNAPTFSALGGASALSLVASGTNVYLNVAPVPEPAALLLIGAAAFGLVRRRRIQSKA